MTEADVTGVNVISSMQVCERDSLRCSHSYPSTFISFSNTDTSFRRRVVSKHFEYLSFFTATWFYCSRPFWAYSLSLCGTSAHPNSFNYVIYTVVIYARSRCLRHMRGVLDIKYSLWEFNLYTGLRYCMYANNSSRGTWTIDSIWFWYGRGPDIDHISHRRFLHRL